MFDSDSQSQRSRSAPSDADSRAVIEQRPAARAGGAGGLTIPEAVWSPPVAEAQWTGMRPQLPLLVRLMPPAAMVLAYLSAVLTAAGHAAAGGVLLCAAFTALLWFGAALVYHGARLVRYRSEAP